MEIFVAYTENDYYPILEQTMNAWAECEDAEVAMIEIHNEKKFEIQRRVVADKMASGRFYVLADIGCIPEAPDLVRQIQRKLVVSKDSLAGLMPVDAPADDVPVGVRVCEKGAVTKWPDKKTVDYNHEHAEAIRRTGKNVEIWTDITFKHLQAC